MLLLDEDSVLREEADFSSASDLSVVFELEAVGLLMSDVILSAAFEDCSAGESNVIISVSDIGFGYYFDETQWCRCPESIPQHAVYLVIILIF